MKKTFILIGLLVLIINQSFVTPNSFDQFVDTLSIVELPYKINRLDSLFHLRPVIYDNVNEMHIQNKYKSVDKNFTHFIEAIKEEHIDKIKYRSVGKFHVDNYIAILIIEDHYVDNEISQLIMKLHTFTKNGIKKGEVAIGGFNIDISECYFEIDKSGIVVNFYNYIQPFEDDLKMYSELTTSQYTIIETGEIKQIRKEKKYVKFSNEPNIDGEEVQRKD